MVNKKRKSSCVESFKEFLTMSQSEETLSNVTNTESIKLKDVNGMYQQNNGHELNGDGENNKSNGLEHILSNDIDHAYLYGGTPKPYSKDSLNALPFNLLAGEMLEYQTCGNEANVYLTNYRLFVGSGQSFFNIPIKAIEYVEMRDLRGLYIQCKYGKVMRISFDTTEDCSEWWRIITSNEASFSNTDQLFAFDYFKQSQNQSNGLIHAPSCSKPGDCEASTYVNEIRRLGFDTISVWRITKINTTFDICSTYPKLHIVPSWISDKDMATISLFRARKRFPTIVWRNKRNGAVIARSSQPEVGWFGLRCEEDEKLLDAIANAAKLDCQVGRITENHSMSASGVSVDATLSTPSLLLVDARSHTAAVANRAKGGGCECQEYYPNCDIQFMSLPNIHAIRRSFHSVRALCLLEHEQSNWYSALEATHWLQNLSLLIRSTLTIVKANDVSGRSTLVHCSDGWDRTPQLVSLAQLLLDPFYRTIKGFRILVEREWLEFGHKFANRCGHSTETDINERSPVFFQWLDVVHQVMSQFPCAFEFNEVFLMKLLEHAYSCLFGTFLCNNVSERKVHRIQTRTYSFWDFLLSGRKDLVNYLYDANITTWVLYPDYSVRRLKVWESVFLCRNNMNDMNNLFDLIGSIDLSDSDSGNFTSNSSVVKQGVTRKTSLDMGRLEPSHLHSYNNEAMANSGAKVPINQLGINDGSVSCDVKKTRKELIEIGTPPQLNGVSSENKEILLEGKSSVIHSDSSMLMNGPDDVPNQCDNVCQTTSESNETLCEFTADTSNSISSKNSTLSDSFNEKLMTDSTRTVIGDTSNEHRKSLDDLCVGLSSSGIDPALATLEHRANNMRQIHSLPDLTNLNRLTLTKSVPDVMASSLYANSDVAKQFPTLENSKRNIFKDYRRYIDEDGLTLSYGLLDKKLIDLELRHAQELARLQKKLDMERQPRLCMQQEQQFRDVFACSPLSFSDGLQEDMPTLPDSMKDERSSISSNDDGWEQVQFDDVLPTRWIPDHLSTQCSNCAIAFTIMYRKHHCRKCGGVFCDPCSNYKISVPEEQLYTPVRVCQKCFQMLSVQKGVSLAS